MLRCPIRARRARDVCAYLWRRPLPCRLQATCTIWPGQAAQLSPARQPKILLTNGFQDEEPYFIAMQNDSLHETLRRLPLANYKRLQWNGVHEWNFWDRSPCLCD